MTNPVTIDAVPGTNRLDLTREFDATVEAVFRAHADPDLFARWIGPRSLTTTITQWDFRTGGCYAFEQRDSGGQTYAFRGVFHTVVENDLIIQTFEYLAAPDEVSLENLRFESLPDRRSRVVARSIFLSADALERMIADGMETGVSEGYLALDELLTQGGAADARSR